MSDRPNSRSKISCGIFDWVNVVEEKRGRGIADGMMAKIGTWFVDQNALRVCVNVDPGNIAARKLYTRYGAQPLNAHWMIWEDARAMGTWADK